MSYTGTVQNGVVVLPPDVKLPEGAAVEVVPRALGRAEASAAEARSRMTHNEVTARLRESHLRLTTALANSRTFKTEVLPRAETVLKGAEARYSAGDISLVEILPVRRDWAAMRLSYLESLRDVIQAWAEVASYVKVL